MSILKADRDDVLKSAAARFYLPHTIRSNVNSPAAIPVPRPPHPPAPSPPSLLQCRRYRAQLS